MHLAFTIINISSNNSQILKTTSPKREQKLDPTSSNLHQLGGPYGIPIHFNPISFTLISLFFLFFFFLLLLNHFFAPKNTNLPPSPPQLPIIGNLHQIGGLPHRSVAALSEKYGPDLMFLKLGQIPTLVVSSARVAREVMKSHDIIFSNRTQNRAANVLLYGCHDVAFASYGEYWRQARKVCVLELLSAKRVESFQHVRDEEVGLVINRIRREANCVDGPDHDSNSSVNLHQLLTSTSNNNIVSRCVLGGKFEDENGNTKFGDVTRKVRVLLTAFCIGDAFPWFKWIDVLRGFSGELKSTFETLDAFFDKVIEEHREKNRSFEEKDFMDII